MVAICVESFSKVWRKFPSQTLPAHSAVMSSCGINSVKDKMAKETLDTELMHVAAL